MPYAHCEAESTLFALRFNGGVTFVTCFFAALWEGGGVPVFTYVGKTIFSLETP